MNKRKLWDAFIAKGISRVSIKCTLCVFSAQGNFTMGALGLFNVTVFTRVYLDDRKVPLHNAGHTLSTDLVDEL